MDGKGGLSCFRDRTAPVCRWRDAAGAADDQPIAEFPDESAQQGILAITGAARRDLRDFSKIFRGLRLGNSGSRNIGKSSRLHGKRESTESIE